MESFIEQLTETLNLQEGSLTPEQGLRDVPNWDSLAVLTTLALVDECFGIQLSGATLNNCDTVADLIAAIEHEKQG